MGPAAAELRELEDHAMREVARFAGNKVFLYLHALWFGAWVGTGGLGGDPFPYSLLTMIVSLEAIFLATVLLIVQNEEARKSERRATLDVVTDVKGERVLEAIARKLEVDIDECHRQAEAILETVADEERPFHHTDQKGRLTP